MAATDKQPIIDVERLVEELKERVAREREAVAADVKVLSQRADVIQAELDRLQLVPRLARLERAARARPAEAPTAGTAQTEPRRPARSAAAPFDYLAFEGRFRPEESVR